MQSPTPEPVPTPAPSPTPTTTPPVYPAPIMPATSANSSSKTSKLPLIIALIVIGLLLVGGAAYALMANSKTATTITPTSEKTPSIAVKGTGPKCLNLNDFPTEAANTYAFSQGVFFKPDTIVYEFPDQLDTTLTPIVNSYNKFKDRKFKISVSGSVRQGDNKSQALAKARAQKVVDELVKRGIPANILYIADPKDSSSDLNSPLASDSSNRNAAIQFDTCAPTTRRPLSKFPLTSGTIGGK